MARTISTVPGFRLPWTQGAYAYPEADTFAAALAGFKRRRKRVIFHMPNSGEAGMRKCVVCGGILGELPKERTIRSGRTETTTGPGAHMTPDKHSTWTYDPQRKQVGNGMHYTCSWSALMLRIFVAYDQH